MPRLRARATLTGFAVAVLALAATGCASSTRATGTSATGSSAPGTRFVGLASWYGQRHHGQATASGEVFDMNKMTAAHRTLPFGTRVKVTNVENGRSVVVRVNDRGPWVKDRVIDVSRAAGRALGLTGEGVARVEVVVLGAE